MATSRTRILLADDDRRIRQLVGITLDDEDFQLCYAGDGAEAVRVAREVQPHLVLLDYQMPGLSGVEVCRALRADPATAEAAIVMLTGQGGDAIRASAYEAGVDDFLTKPFSPLTLEQKIRSMLARKVAAADGRPSAPADGRPASETDRGAAPAGELTRAQLMLYATDLNRSMRELRRAHAELRESYLATIEALATALELRDTATQGHCRRVTRYTLAAAHRMDVEEETLEQIHWGALLHDVGKIGVPDAILLKPSPLLPEEWQLMMRHPDLGYDLLRTVPFLTVALSIVRFHHERYAGGGYPLGLEGEEIPFGARLFAVADALDAITVDRPYQRARSWDEARAEIERNRGTQFDPTVVDAYLEVFDHLPALQDGHEP